MRRGGRGRGARWSMGRDGELFFCVVSVPPHIFISLAPRSRTTTQLFHGSRRRCRCRRPPPAFWPGGHASGHPGAHVPALPRPCFLCRPPLHLPHPARRPPPQRLCLAILCRPALSSALSSGVVGPKAEEWLCWTMRVFGFGFDVPHVFFDVRFFSLPPVAPLSSCPPRPPRPTHPQDRQPSPAAAAAGAV